MNPEVESKAWDHTEEVIYGLGGVRKVEKFYETFGIDVKKKTIEENMCTFVDGKAETSMHMRFHPHLRKDGMGVDYTNISFRFVDPKKIQKQRVEQQKRMEAERAVQQQQQQQRLRGDAKAVGAADAKEADEAGDDTDDEEPSEEEDESGEAELEEEGKDDTEEAEEEVE
jgi:regulator of protease activity HflC (stomatin/prohibitin superfamily)